MYNVELARTCLVALEGRRQASQTAPGSPAYRGALRRMSHQFYTKVYVFINLTYLPEGAKPPPIMEQHLDDMHKLLSSSRSIMDNA
jgi:hypothetical protein